MKLFLPKAQTGGATKEQFFDYAPSSTSELLGATFSQAFDENPLSSMIRGARLNKAYRSSGARLTAEEFSLSEFARPGISVGEDGITANAARILAERYDERETRKAILSKSPSGIGMAAAQLGVGFAAGMLDPINIAASFIPVTRVASVGRLLAKGSKTSQRLKRGALEGTVGAAVVEPIVYGSARYEQNQDYTVANSLLNIAFGTVLGGGLHVGAGKVGDILRPETARAALSTSVKQHISNEPVNVGPVLNAAPEVNQARARLTSPPKRVLQRPFYEPVRKGTKLPPMLQPALSKAPKAETLLQFVRRMGGINTKDANINDINWGSAAKKRPNVRKDGFSLDDMALMAQEEGFIGQPLDAPNAQRVEINDLVDAINEELGGNIKISRLQDDLATARETARQNKEYAEELGINLRGLSDEELIKAIDDRESIFGLGKYEGGADTAGAAEAGMTEQEFFQLRSAAAQSGEPVTWNEFADDMKAADEAWDSRPAEDNSLDVLVSENEMLMDDVRFLMEEGADPQDFIDDMAALDTLTQKADVGYDAALRGAVNCLKGLT